MNSFDFICKVAWLAERYFSSLLKSNLYLANSFSIFLLGNKTEGKSGFVSHTKLIAEATFMDLFHS